MVSPIVATIEWKVTQSLSVMVLVKGSREGLKGFKKGKEKAHNGGGGDLGSDDEGSYLIKFKKCLTTHMVNFSEYT